MNPTTQPFTLPVFFSGQAQAHGLQSRNPEAAGMLVLCTGMGWNADKKYAYLDLKIEASTVPENVGLTWRAFVNPPEQGMKEGRIKALEAEFKALKIAFAPEGQQPAIAAQVNAASGAMQYNFDFAGKVAAVWHEPGNPDAPRGTENRSHPAYNQGYSYTRWLSRAKYNEVINGQIVVSLRNSPLKGGTAATQVASAGVGFQPPTGTAPGGFQAPVTPTSPAPQTGLPGLPGVSGPNGLAGGPVTVQPPQGDGAATML